MCSESRGVTDSRMPNGEMFIGRASLVKSKPEEKAQVVAPPWKRTLQLWKLTPKGTPNAKKARW